MPTNTDSTRPRAAILGCRGQELSSEETDFFAETQPLGFILFKRNCDTPAQVSALVADLRRAVGRPDAPVLIDQEGGRVQRLTPPHWTARPPQGVFADLVAVNEEYGVEAAALNAELIANDLKVLGIDVNCLPLLDVPVPGSHDIIGNRAYGENINTVIMLGRAVIQGLLRGGVLPVIKHIPGHGRAISDSHLELPTVQASIQDLRARDFAPFKALASAPWGMTAHIVYSAIDPKQPATLSSHLIRDVIRGEIGFDGFLVSDDVTMKALYGDYGELSAAAIEAGCDAVLHCNGDMDGMMSVMSAVPTLSDAAWRRFNLGSTAISRNPDYDRTAAETRLKELLSAIH